MPTPRPTPIQPDSLVEKALARLQSFLHLEAAGGIVLLVTSMAALVIANSPLADLYGRLLSVDFEIRLGGFGLAKPLLLWINDGLMAVFFLLVGLELKRELLEGHLSDLRKIALPAFAAVGGMAAPAAIYAALNWGDPVAMRGWAIPAATDIAFALGILSLLGNRVPTALKAFLLSVAIFDDLGAIVIIALFYTAELAWEAHLVAGVLTLALLVLNRAGVTRPAAYFVVGVPLWIAVLKSGVHATVAGVVLAFFIPLRVAGRAGVEDGADNDRESPLHLLERTLHPWVAFLVLPAFAFANAGVSVLDLSMADLVHPVPLGIVAGLFLGKQVGIMASSWLSVRLRLGALPAGVGWKQLYGAALLCGIGFTMSLFIASLAFEQDAASPLGLERLGILAGTLISALAGYLVLRAVLGDGDAAPAAKTTPASAASAADRG